MAKQYDVYFKNKRMQPKTYLINDTDDLNYLLKFLSRKGLKSKVKFIGYQGRVVWGKM